MPFTFSHPALIIPIYKIRKKWFSISGLITGSIAPDFEYFFKMRKDISNYSHTLLSILYFNLPLALIVIYVFHAIVRKQLIKNLPSFLLCRVSDYYNTEWKLIFLKKAPILILSVILGCLTHIGWDFFTKYIANLLYTNQDKIFSFSSWIHYSYVYSTIHFTFSFIGLGFLTMSVMKLPVRKHVVPDRANHNFWLVVYVMTFLFFIPRVIFGADLQALDFLVSFISAFLMSLILSSLYFSYK